MQQACKGANVSRSKNVNELSKHAVLSFVRQTLTRCQKFEDTGISCFSGPAFRDIFYSASSHCSDSECTDFNGDGEPANHYTTVPQLQNNFIGKTNSIFMCATVAFLLNVAVPVQCMVVGLAIEPTTHE